MLQVGVPKVTFEGKLVIIEGLSYPTYPSVVHRRTNYPQNVSRIGSISAPLFWSRVSIPRLSPIASTGKAMASVVFPPVTEIVDDEAVRRGSFGGAGCWVLGVLGDLMVDGSQVLAQVEEIKTAQRL